MNRLKMATIAVLDGLLPQGLKNSMFHLFYHVAHAEFERFAHDYAFAPHMHHGLAAAARRGLAPRTIVDVGAFEGNWSRLAKRIWPSSCLIMVEPNVENNPRLLETAKELQAELLCELLGAQDGREVRFNMMGSGSSVLSERSPLPRAVEVRRLRTLDSLLREIERPAFLKIDAQGYELEILTGASRLLPEMEAVLLEIALMEINEGAPLLHEVVPFMKQRGFVAYDVLEIHRRPLDKALNQVDILFLSERSALLADKRHFSLSGSEPCA